MGFEEKLKEEFGDRFKTDKKIPDELDSFHAQRIPSITIDKYYDRIIENTKCENGVVHAMWVYLRKVVYECNIVLNYYNIHRIVSQLFNIAIKFIDDDPISMHLFCRIVGYDKDEYVRLEKEMLEIMNFDIFVN